MNKEPLTIREMKEILTFFPSMAKKSDIDIRQFIFISIHARQKLHESESFIYDLHELLKCYYQTG